MGDNEQKALQLMAEAEKKLTQQKGFLGSLFGCVSNQRSFAISVGVGKWSCVWSSLASPQPHKVLSPMPSSTWMPIHYAYYFVFMYIPTHHNTYTQLWTLRLHPEREENSAKVRLTEISFRYEEQKVCKMSLKNIRST